MFCKASIIHLTNTQSLSQLQMQCRFFAPELHLDLRQTPFTPSTHRQGNRMSISPFKWRDTVIEHYGSISNFHDAPTVGIMREQIASRRADLKIMLDLEITHPDAMSKEQLTELKEEDAQYAALDGDLERWQAARDSVKA
jgi:hypothetical protein